MPSDPISEALKLDHFKVYKQYQPTQGAKVRLQGQFDKTAIAAKVDQMDYYSTPVSKSNSKIINRNAHLAFHQLHQTKQEPRRVVVFKNQFGLQKLILGRPFYLLAPSQKLEKGLSFPKRLDHFKAYRVLYGEPINRPVSLADQFDKQAKVEVERPDYFCVPVKKTHGTKTTPISNPRGHLVFYTIQPKIYKIPKGSKDQFGTTKMLLGTSVLLGVPTIKLDWAPYG